eukprot:TRINITY_DN4339_c0_g1_i2.p1 TRINITY_DN4339_c0_g1~~TRINITY_DN4339_c0_g1_i2.p1  ORF type:complete len:470 (+),score=207.21 TRINITY_DN4339_c0_g1_i2:950-2359(+)
MLAIYRCDEIAEAALKGFHKDLTGLETEVKNGNFVENFGEQSTKIMDNRLGEYDRPSSRYHSDVPAKKRETLLSNMLKSLHDLFTLQVHKARQMAVKFFDEKFVQSLPKDGTAAQNFAQIAEASKSETLSYFKGLVEASLVEKSGWSYSVELSELTIKIDDIISKEKANQLQALHKEIKSVLHLSLGNPLSRLLGEPNNQMWAKIRETFHNVAQRSEELLVSRLQEGFRIPEDEVGAEKAKLKELLFSTIKEKLNEKAKYISNEMENSFDDVFKRGSNGLPRTWKHVEELEVPFQEGRERGKMVLNLFSTIRLDEKHDKYTVFDASGDVEPELVIFNFEQSKQLMTSFTRYTEGAYQNALTVVENANTKNQIPIYLLVLLLVLGFNEITTIMFNPLYLFLTIFIGVVGYIGYIFNLGGVYLNIAQVMAKNFWNTTQDLLKKYLAEHVAQQQQQQQQQPQQPQQHKPHHE